jgi:hypothetical protein
MPRVFQNEAAMETATTVAIHGRETQIGTLPIKSEIMNFTPTKIRRMEIPVRSLPRPDRALLRVRAG